MSKRDAYDINSDPRFKGLRGFSGLSDAEREVFYNRFPEARNDSPTQVEIAYRNMQFIDKFGMDTFLSTPLEERDRLYKDAVISDVFNNEYKDAEELQDIQNPAAQLHLLENNYQTDKLRAEAAQKQYQTALENAQAGIETVIRNPEDYRAITDKINNKLLEEAKQIDKEAVKKSVADRSSYIKSQYLQGMVTDPNFVNKINTEFDDYMSQRDSEGNALFPYYAAYKDSRALSRKLDIYKKIDILSNIQGIDSLAAEQEDDNTKRSLQWKAVDIANDDVHHLYYEGRNVFEKYRDSERLAVAKGVASFGNTMTGLVALTKVGNLEDLSNYLSGKNANGETLPWYLNPQYYSKLDQYGLWTVAEQNQADLNGGLSPYSVTRDVGEEYKWFTDASIFEANAMKGYAIAHIAEDAALGLAGKGVSAGVRTLSKLAPTGRALANAAKISESLERGALHRLGDLTRMQIETIGESAMEGVSSHDQVIAQAKQTEDDDVEKFLQDPTTQANFKSEAIKRYKERRKQQVGDTSKLPLDVLYNDDEFIPSDTKLWEQVVNEVIDEGVGGFKANRQRIVEEAAGAAYITKATTMQMKNSLGDAAFKQYMYAKPIKLRTRNAIDSNLIRQTAEGTIEAVEPTMRKKVLAGVKTIAGGFFDELTDESLDQGAVGLGMSLVNSRTEQIYNPSAMSAASTALSAIASWATGAEQSLLDPSAWEQGFVGGLSPLGLNINPTAIRYISKANRAQLRELSSLERVNQFLMNPLFTEVNRVSKEYEETSKKVEEINKVIAEHGTDFENIIGTLENVQTIENARKAGDTLGLKDSEIASVFNFFSYLNTLSQAGATSSLFNSYQRRLEELANGNVSAEEIASFLSQPENKEMVTSLGQEEASQQAAQIIQRNATKLSEYYQQYKTISSYLDSTFGNALNQSTKNELIYSSLMADDWKKRLTELETSISGRSKPSTSTTRGARTTQALREELSTIQAQIDAIGEQSKDTEAYLNAQVNNPAEGVIVTREGADELIKLNNKKYQQVLTELKQKQQQIQDELTTAEKEPLKIVSAEEILSLSPLERAYMLTNPSKFTAEQQTEIDKAKDILAQKDTDYLKTVQDASRLASRVENSDSHYRDLLENTKGLSFYIQSRAASSRASSINLMRQLQRDDTIDRLDKAPTNDDFFNIATNVHSDILKEIKSLGNDYDGRIDKALEVVKLKEDATALINDNPSYGVMTRKIFLTGLADVLRGKKSLEEAISALEDVVDSETVIDYVREDYNNLLRDLTALNYQRDATRVQKREEAKLKKEETKDGKNYGWSGYKVGDTVYKTSNGQKGTVTHFSKGNKRVTYMHVQFTRPDGSSYNISIKNTSKSTITKVKPTEPTDQKETPKASTSPEVRADGKGLISEEVTPLGGDVPTAETFTGEATEVTLDDENEVIPPNVPVTTVSIPIVDTTDEGNDIDALSEDILIGNAFYTYAVDDLTGLDRKQTERIPAKKGDTLDQVQTWLKNRNIKLQEIIDNELGNIFRDNPNTEIRFLQTKVTPSERPSGVQTVIFNVIEYTDAVKKHHREDRGGVVTANGKQWLVVGTLGYNEASSSQKKIFTSLHTKIQQHRWRYFKDNPDAELFVDQTYHTIINDIAAGRIVKQMLGESPAGLRSIAELADGKVSDTNPQGLSVEDLILGVQVGDTIKAINVKGDETIYPPVDKVGNQGNVFILLQVPNGGYIPVALKPTRYRDLVQGSDLRASINSAINGLMSTDYAERSAALRQLQNIFVLDKDDNNILIGQDGRNTLSFVRGTTTLRTFNLDKGVNRVDILNAFQELNPRIAITIPKLSDETQLDRLVKAGALVTDIAKLGTSNVSYTLKAIDTNGNPIASTTTKPSGVSRNTEYTRKQRSSTIYMGKVYREEGGVFRDENGRIIDTSTVEGNKLTQSLQDSLAIKVNNLTPISKVGNTNYYSINNNIVKLLPDGSLVRLTPAEAEEFTRAKIEKASNMSKEQAAEERVLSNEEMLRQLSSGEAALSEWISIDEVSPEDAYTDEALRQLLGETPTTVEQPQTTPIITPTITGESVSESENINNGVKKSLQELQETKNITTFAGVLNDEVYGDRLFTLAEEKGWNWTDETTDSHIEAFLKSKGIATTNITNIEDWFEMIKNCK